jgi:outer membrane receptor protein involved in Fe transport
MGHSVNMTFSGRYNRTTVRNRDQLRPQAGLGSLTGDHVFGRFNPSIGITFNPISSINAYGSYSEASRAPTSIELGCADPNAPCKLPNAMAGDPPLEQVISRTLEAGVRGRQENNLNWTAGWFFTENRNDILFVASGQTGLGYFKNFGKTRRAGFQLDASTRLKRASFGGGYTFLNATYQSKEDVAGSSNSTSDALARGLDGRIEIQPGKRIPLVPQHMLKLFADFQVTSKFLVDVGAVVLAGSYARGNENNQHQPDGVYYLAAGSTESYAIANLGARYQLHRHVQLFGQINNLLDTQYYTAAQLGATGFNNTGNFIARPFAAVNGEFPIQHTTFFAPGAPRMIWGGLRFQF